MAKNNKGGLGRGLNSLLGGYEAPLEQDRELVNPTPQKNDAQKQETAAKPVQETKPKVERELIRAEDLAQDERETIKQEQVPAVKAAAQDVQPQVSVQKSDAATASQKTVIASGTPVIEKVTTAVEKAVDTPIAKTPVKGVVASREYIEEDDGVRIKGVMARDPRPAAKPAATVVRDEPAAADEVKEEPKAIDEVPVHLIKPNPDQPRTNFKPEEIQELAASIEKDGLLQPILVREMPDGYQIIAGERRWQACKAIGLSKVPVRIKEADDMKVLELALIENLQRSDLNPIEEAYGYKRMMERGGKTQSEVASAVSKGRSTIANALRLLELPEEAQQLLYEEKITAGHARAILSIPTKEGRKKLTDKLMNEKLTVREAEAIARLLSGKPKTPAQEQKPPMPKVYKTTAKSLSESLDAKVRIKSANGKNKIEIEFKDEDDLQRLYDLISE